MDEGRQAEHWILYGTTDVAMDRDSRLQEHIICRACGYDLVSMQKGQQCPECGSPVAISIGGDLLSHSQPDWTAHVGQHVRISGLLLMTFPIVMAIGVTIAIAISQPVSGILPSIILVPWCYCLLQATRLEPARPGLSRHDLAVRYSAGALGLIILLSFAVAAAKVPVPGLLVFGLASLAFLATLTTYLLWLAELILRVPANDVCDTLRRRLWVVLGLTVFIALLVLAQGALGVVFLAFFGAVPAWMLCVLPVGYSCVQAGEVILCESRMARQNWLVREALLDKERRFREPPSSRPATSLTQAQPPAV